MICKNCGTVHNGEAVLPGSGWIEFVLYLWLIFPGVIYSIWRRSKTTPTCGSCGSRDLVSEDTPVGRRLLAENYPGGTPRAASRVAAPQAKPAGRFPVYLALLIAAVFFSVLALQRG